MEQKSLRTKLIPRDLSESLGKLPPQAIDMEEAVLGAILLKKDVFESLFKIIKADHFYKESHKLVFEACSALYQQAAPIDLRTVVNQLRTTGHLQIVGGATFIAELQSKVSTEANVQHHARVIIEMYLKRETIQLASRLNQIAYEDSSDPLEFIPNAIQDIQFLYDRSIKKDEKSSIEDLWKELIIVDEPPEVPPYITIDGTPIATPGNHSLLIGKKKSRKSLFITYEASLFFEQNGVLEDEMVIFDTEQGQRHVWKYMDRIHRMTGKKIPIFALRGKSHMERRNIIEKTLKYWPKKFKLVVIDGIRDLISNINDPEQCSELLTWIEKLIVDHPQLHIVNILHINKTDNNARGHIGSELLNKVEVTIEMELDEEKQLSLVKCESSREKGFETFAITHDENGLPMIAEAPAGDGKLPNDERKRRLEMIFEGEPIKYKQLIQGIRTHFAAGESKAKQIKGEFDRMGWIVKSGRDNSPDTVYKLQVSGSAPAPTKVHVPDNLKPLHPKKVEPPEPPPDLFSDDDETPF